MEEYIESKRGKKYKEILCEIQSLTESVQTIIDSEQNDSRHINIEKIFKAYLEKVRHDLPLEILIDIDIESKTVFDTKECEVHKIYNTGVRELKSAAIWFTEANKLLSLITIALIQKRIQNI